MPQHYNCILKNNTDKHVRILVRSWYGEGDYWLAPQASTPTVLVASFKSLIAFDQTTKLPIGWYFMEVKQETIFKVNMQYNYASGEWIEPASPPDGEGFEYFSQMLGGMPPYEGESM